MARLSQRRQTAAACPKSSRTGACGEGVTARAPEAMSSKSRCIGPGFGESVVVHIGDGHWIVIDSCRRTEVLPLRTYNSRRCGRVGGGVRSCNALRHGSRRRIGRTPRTLRASKSSVPLGADVQTALQTIYEAPTSLWRRGHRAVLIGSVRTSRCRDRGSRRSVGRTAVLDGGICRRLPKCCEGRLHPAKR